MATAKLTNSRVDRAQDVFVISQRIPDGRFVVIGQRDFYVADIDRCSCGDHRYKGNTCKHMVAVQNFTLIQHNKKEENGAGTAPHGRGYSKNFLDFVKILVDNSTSNCYYSQVESESDDLTELPIS